MMHERKRLLNHSTAEDGLLVARSSAQHTEATAMNEFLVLQPADAESDTGSDATDSATLPTPPQDRLQRSSEDNPPSRETQRKVLLQSTPPTLQMIATKPFLRR